MVATPQTCEIISKSTCVGGWWARRASSVYALGVIIVNETYTLAVYTETLQRSCGMRKTS